MLNLRSVDLNLLPVFEAAFEERNLSRAADRLAMTPPAVSQALARLRVLFRDELFVRRARGVVPTPTAERIYAELRPALGSVRSLVADLRGFDAKTSQRQFVIAIPHPLGPLIAVRLREQLAAAAPKFEVAFSTRSRPVDLDRGLREGRVDAAVDWLTPALGDFRTSTLFEDRITAVARKGHPALRKGAKGMALGDCEFVRLRPRVEGMTGIPGLDERRRMKLKIALEVSEIVEIFMVAHQSDLCGLIPFSMVKAARDLLGLQVIPSFPVLPMVPVKLYWHASRETDKAHAFLRQRIAMAAKQIM